MDFLFHFNSLSFMISNIEKERSYFFSSSVCCMNEYWSSVPRNTDSCSAFYKGNKLAPPGFVKIIMGREGGPAFLAHTKQKVSSIVGLRPYG